MTERVLVERFVVVSAPKNHAITIKKDSVILACLDRPIKGYCSPKIRSESLADVERKSEIGAEAGSGKPSPPPKNCPLPITDFC